MLNKPDAKLQEVFELLPLTVGRAARADDKVVQRLELQQRALVEEQGRCARKGLETLT